MVALGVITALGLCFCIYNYWFQKERFKRMFDNEEKKVAGFNKPGAWLAYSLLLFTALLAMISYLIAKYYIAVISSRSPG